MLPLDEAVDRILTRVSPAGTELIPLCDAYRRVVASDIVSSINLPGFDNSAMDGYAVVSTDLVQVGESAPVELPCVGEVAAGEGPGIDLKPGQCVRIFTGAVLPKGADAVVMQEETQVVGESPRRVRFLDSVKPWENVRFAGEDVKKDSVILSAGTMVTAGRIALGAACGVSEVNVGQRPRVGLLATGNELVEAGETLGEGQIYESNRPVLAQLVNQAGGIANCYPIIPDDLDLTCSALATAFEECDVVITSGAVSVGEYDYVKSAIERLGGGVDFWRVSVRPGKPFVFGNVKGKCFFGLPGNPISTFVTFLLLVRPAILRMQGAKNAGLPRTRGTLVEPFVNHGTRRHFARVSINEKGDVRSAGLQASHALSSLASANGLLDVPPQTVWETGCDVEVLLIDS